jgi:hypothetical protein
MNSSFGAVLIFHAAPGREFPLLRVAGWEKQIPPPALRSASE